VKPPAPNWLSSTGNHVHLLVNFPPKVALSALVWRLLRNQAELERGFTRHLLNAGFLLPAGFTTLLETGAGPEYEEIIMSFTPTPTMVSLAQSVMVAMAFADTIRPIVVGYETDILKNGQWRIRPEFADRLNNEIIIDPKRAYLMSDEDALVFHAECKKARDTAGLKVENDEHCPLLVAENLVMQCERALIDEMATITGMSSNNLCCIGMDKRKQYIDLTLRLLAPFITRQQIQQNHLNPAPAGK
jgi:hypothetical protein